MTPPSGSVGESRLHRVFIGMPVYNGCPYIEAALQSLVAQTFGDWRLLIADNCSTDDTAAICQRFTDADSRITYVRHTKNEGAGYNFRYVLDAAETELFMWAAADDVWEPEFLQATVDLLDANSLAGAAFCEFDTIDSFGQCVRTYPSLKPFSSPPERPRDAVSNYVWTAEYMGKANVFYALYRRLELTAATRHLLYESSWGLDMAMVLAVMTRHPYVITNRVLFHKRQVRPTDTPGDPHAIIVPPPSPYRLTREMLPSYFTALWMATRGTPVCGMIMRIMVWRLVGTCIHTPFRLLRGLCRVKKTCCGSPEGR
jgi:glycosyltransferase involved in cell wall biosynthesis